MPDGTACIIMATYNGEKYLPDQLESFEWQTFKKWTLLACDDGSTDGTLDILKKFQKKHGEKKVKIIKNTSGKHGAMNNFAFALEKAPKADYYALSDQDDIWLQPKLEEIIGYMPEPGDNFPYLFYSDLVIVDKDLNPIHPSMLTANKLDLDLENPLPYLLVDNYIPGCTMVINHALKEKATPIFEGAGMHDWWIALVAAVTGMITQYSFQFNLYRQHENNVLGAEEIAGTLETAKARAKKTLKKSTYENWEKAQKIRLAQAEELVKRFNDYEKIKVVKKFIKISKEPNTMKHLQELKKNHFVPIRHSQYFKLLFGNGKE